MFGSLGIPEILFILVVALLIFGPRRLPEIGRTIGRALGEFRRATTDLKRSIDTELTLEETGPKAAAKEESTAADDKSTAPEASSVPRQPDYPPADVGPEPESQSEPPKAETGAGEE